MANTNDEDQNRRVLDRLEAINNHISAFKKEISDFGDVVLRIEDSIGGNKLSDNKGLFHKVEKLAEKTDSLSTEITLLKDQVSNYKSGLTWGSRLGVSSLIAFFMWYFTKK